MKCSSTSRMCTSRNNGEQQQCNHHRHEEGSGEAAEAFDLEAQLPERRLLHVPLQQHAYDYYHGGYGQDMQEEWSRQEAGQQQQEADEQWKAQPRSSSRSRSGSSNWWEARCSHYSSGVGCTQERPTTPSSSSGISTASSSRRSRERRFSILNTRVSGALPPRSQSEDGGSALCCNSSQQQRGEDASNDGDDVEVKEEEDGAQRHPQCKQILPQQQGGGGDSYDYFCQRDQFSERYDEQQDERKPNSKQLQRGKLPLQHKSNAAAEENKEEEAYGGAVHGSSRAHHRHPHKRHSVELQLQQVNGNEEDSLRERSSSSSSEAGAHPLVKKLQERKEKKSKDEDEMTKSFRHFEQQQQREAGQSCFYGFRSGSSSSHTSRAVVYQWKRRVAPDSALTGAGLQQQKPLHMGEKRQQQAEQKEETEGSSEEERRKQLLDEDEVVQSEAETYDILCGLRKQKTATERVNGYITPDFFFHFEKGKGEDQQQLTEREEQLGKDQQQQQQQRQPHPQDDQKQHQHQQKQHKQQLKQQQKQQQKQKQQLHQMQKQKQKQQVDQYALSRSTSPTALEEGQLYLQEKQQRCFESFVKDGFAAAEPNFCLLGSGHASLHAEEAVCAWLFDILVAHLEGSRGQPIPPDSIRRMHQEQVRCPVFVTWMKKKRESSSFERVDVELRGCIGSLNPIPVLEIGEYALTSAFRDRRFRPIALREVPHLACYVSLLHSYEDVKHPLDWEIGVHGTTIKFFASDGQTYTATYLPEVAKELGMTQREALTSLVRKSGYSGAIPDNFLARLSVTRYRSSQARLDYDTYLRRYGRYASP